MNRQIAIASLLLALSPLTPALGQTAMHDHAGSHPQAASAELVPAEVRAIDLKAGRITLRHGELANLGMAAMTMSFALAPGLKLPEGLKVGDKVRIRAENPGGTLTLTTLTR